MFPGEIVEQDFDLVEELVEALHPAFEAGGGEAKLAHGRAPGIHGMLGQDFHSQGPGLEQGPEGGLGCIALHHGPDGLFVIVHPRGMDAVVDAVFFGGGLESQLPVRQPGADLFRVEPVPAHQTGQPGDHPRALGGLGTQPELKHQPPFVERRTGELGHRVDRVEQRFHKLGHILRRELVA